MTALIILGILVIICVAITSTVYILKKKNNKKSKKYLIIALILALPITYYMTGYFKYKINENTYSYGWPVPTVVFHRDSAEEPWLCYSGATVLLAYPINYMLYSALPILGILIYTIKSGKKSLTNQST